MQVSTQWVELAPSITGLDIRTDKFKTKRISVTFALPLTDRDTAIVSLLSRLITRSTGRFPTPVALERRLLALYGARFSSQVIKLADYQLLNCSITVIDDRFALHGEALSTQAADLLCDALFEPNFPDGDVPAEDLAICRRLLQESIESAINDKRKYAISQMYRLMCEDEPFGIEIGGSLETVASITGKQVVEYWRAMLRTAPIHVAVVGQDDPAPVFESITARFCTPDRRPVPIDPVFRFKPAEQVREKTETMNVAQGKLVMGFRSDISTLEQNNMALRIMCDIFGGAPYSKLFTIVREQMSLCYYCAARLQSQKGFICVDSGVDNKNIEAAREGILTQLEAMKNGDFDDAVLEASKMSMADGARSVTDSQDALEAWYLLRMFDKTVDHPEAWIRQIDAVDRRQIQDAARSVTQDTVFILKAQEAAE